MDQKDHNGSCLCVNADAMFHSCKKNPVLPIEKFPFLVLARNTIMLTPYYPFRSISGIIYQVVAYGRLKTKENFSLLALKVVAVTYEVVAYKRFQIK